MLEEAARAGIPGVVYTLVYASGDDDEYVQDVIDAVEPHGGVVRFALLTCDLDVLLQRVTDESRAAFGKLRDPDIVRAMLAEHEMTTPAPHRPGLALDTTHAGPAEVATRIAHELEMNRRKDS